MSESNPLKKSSRSEDVDEKYIKLAEGTLYEEPSVLEQGENSSEQAASAQNETLANESLYQEARERFQGMAERGDTAMSRPIDFQEFREAHHVELFNLNEAGELVALQGNAPRADQMFYGLPDAESDTVGLFLGYEVKTTAEWARANYDEFSKRVSKFFNIQVADPVRPEKPTLIKPALIRKNGDLHEVVLKGVIAM